MRLAVEAPIQALPIIEELTDFNFVLTHLVLQDKRYADWYTASRKFTMLDCSTFELGHPVTVEELKQAINIIHPNVVIAPDHLHDAEATKTSLFQFLIDFDFFIKQPTTRRILVGAVLQGKTLTEVRQLHSLYARLKELYYIYVPYDLELKEFQYIEHDETRHMVARLAVLATIAPLARTSGKHYHLLGVGLPVELLIAKQYPFVTSVDTSAPIVAAIQKLKPLEVKQKLIRPDNYFELEISQELEKEIRHSVQRFKILVT